MPKVTHLFTHNGVSVYEPAKKYLSAKISFLIVFNSDLSKAPKSAQKRIKYDQGDGMSYLDAKLKMIQYVDLYK